MINIKLILIYISVNFQSVCVTSDELPAGDSRPEAVTELIKVYLFGFLFDIIFYI